ncbi:MAG: hypothetical protein ACK4K1_07750 [Flavobacterium sp.]
MAKVIEFIGPSGAGKSTVYNDINHLMTNDNNFSTFIGSKIDQIEIIKTFKKKRFKIFNFTEFQKVYINDTDKQQDSLNKFLKINKELIDELWNAVANDNKHVNNAEIRQQVLNFVYKRITETQLILDSTNHEYIIHDDGLFHNSVFFYNRNKWKELEYFFEFFHKFYQPSKVIFFNIQLPELVERVRNRKIKTILENDLSESDLIKKCKESITMFEIKKQFLKKNNVKNIEIDATLDVQTKVQMILSFLNSHD